jgi:hypothetical protein
VRERECERDRETGLNIANRIRKHISFFFYYNYYNSNYRNLKKNILELIFYINRIFTPEKITIKS